MQKVINFSGGRTSALMTIMCYQPGDLVLFCDTGREHPKTYKFINDFEAHEEIPVIRLGSSDSFNNLLAKRKHKEIPNRAKRFCTTFLKVKPARRYIRSLGLMAYENYIGFRADEKDRISKSKKHWKQVIPVFPLDDFGITKPDVLDYWNSKPYNLEIPSILGNCTLCFQKGKNAIMAILREYPELAKPWIEDEKANINGYTYLTGTSIENLLNLAQNSLFKDYRLEELSPAINCACTS